MTDTRNWRLGRHYNIHGYAVAPGSFDDEPIFMALDSNVAEQIIEDHRGHLEVRRETQALNRQVAALARENHDQAEKIVELKSHLAEADRLISRLRGNAFRTLGTARSAYNVLGQLLDENPQSTADTLNAEAACE